MHKTITLVKVSHKFKTYLVAEAPPLPNSGPPKVPERPPTLPERGPNLPERGPNLPERMSTITERTYERGPTVTERTYERGPSVTERVTTITERGPSERTERTSERTERTSERMNERASSQEKSVMGLVNSYQQRMGGQSRDVNRNSTSWYERGNNNYQNVETTFYSTSDVGQLVARSFSWAVVCSLLTRINIIALTLSSVLSAPL